MPRLVVMMPAKNAVVTVGTAVESTLKAMPADAQLVVFNDGSSDDTSAAVERFADRRIKILSVNESIGSGRARQTILESTDSEFVANMDSDDVCLPWRFRVQLKSLRENEFLFGGSIPFQKSPPKIDPPVLSRVSPAESPALLLAANLFSHSTFVASRRSVLQAGGYRDLRRGQDYDLWLRAAVRGIEIRRIRFPVVCYRLSVSQISQAPDYVSKIRSDARLKESYEQLLKILLARRGIDPCSSFESVAPLLEAQLSVVNRWHFRRCVRLGVPFPMASP